MLFILITSFTMLNLFIAVIIDATQSEAGVEASRHIDDLHVQTREELGRLREEIRSLHALIESGAR